MAKSTKDLIVIRDLKTPLVAVGQNEALGEAKVKL